LLALSSCSMRQSPVALPMTNAGAHKLKASAYFSVRNSYYRESNPQEQ
jgi:hypothetical protein